MKLQSVGREKTGAHVAFSQLVGAKATHRAQVKNQNAPPAQGRLTQGNPQKLAKQQPRRSSSTKPKCLQELGHCGIPLKTQQGEGCRNLLWQGRSCHSREGPHRSPHQPWAHRDAARRRPTWDDGQLPEGGRGASKLRVTKLCRTFKLGPSNSSGAWQRTGNQYNWPKMGGWHGNDLWFPLATLWPHFA